MRTLSRFTIVLVVASALVAAAVGGTALASTHASAAASKYPPCTKAALSAGLKRGPAKVTNGRFLKPFGCARNWAYSAAIVGKGNAAFEITVLYHNNNGRWQTSRRAGPCRTHAVPKKIYRPACQTN
ncbi:MAG TPA: hypothetical protein VFW09_02290 [Solirubrobacteraceae bacterium]|jgi:hypothetical protein|nr:hypothetical protein [Solirubrobacteraceae bacterium]